MSYEHSLKKGTRYSFIPNKLNIQKHPELKVFPFNIMFASFIKENNEVVMKHALYEPDLSSLKKESEKWSMYYHNAYQGNSWVLIEYNIKNRSYFGEKTVNNKSVGMAVGMHWKSFFIHLTGLGIEDGENVISNEDDFNN